MLLRAVRNTLEAFDSSERRLPRRLETSHAKKSELEITRPEPSFSAMEAVPERLTANVNNKGRDI